mgnify:CR=1 FL=1
MFYLEYNLELSEESEYEYYVLHFKGFKVYEDDHVYDAKGGYVMVKDMGNKVVLVNKSNEVNLDVLNFVEKLNKK